VISLSDRQLTTLARQWQKRLGLGDWHIRARWAPPSEIGTSYGTCRFDINHKTALISVLSEEYADAYAFPSPPWDVDNIIVHELVHLVLAPLQIEDDVLQEQIINQLAEAFVPVLERKANG